MRPIYLLLITASLSSCGYFNSGTWKDDPENWGRVFGQDAPEKVEVVHSHFWKSAHFTYEFIAYFEIKTDEEFVKEYFIDYYDLRKYDEKNAKNIPLLGQGDFPDWFVKKDKDNYDIWLGDEFDFTLYIDKVTENIYFSMVQF